MQNEGPDEKSSYGDGIYNNNNNSSNNFFGRSSSLSVLAIRKRLLDQYIRDCIGQHEGGHENKCGCHFQFGASDQRLLDELKQCHRKFDTIDERKSATDESAKEEELPLSKRARQRRQKESSRTYRERHKPREAQQVTTAGVTKEGSAFTRLLGASESKHSTSIATARELTGARALHLSSCKEPNVSSAAYPVSHRHHRKLCISNSKQNYSISDNERAPSLFIESDIVQSSSSSLRASESFVGWDRYFGENNNEGEESQVGCRKIYEPPQPSGSCEQQGSQFHSWPCCCSIRAATAAASCDPIRRSSDLKKSAPVRLLRPTQSCKQEFRQLHGHLESPTAPEEAEATTTTTTTTSNEDDESDNQFDIRSALDCVVEISPTWSEVSSVEISSSTDRHQLEKEEKEEDELHHHKGINRILRKVQEEKCVKRPCESFSSSQELSGESSPASWLNELQKMGSDGSKEANNDRETKTYRGSDLSERLNRAEEKRGARRSRKKQKRVERAPGEEEGGGGRRREAEVECKEEADHLASDQINQRQISPAGRSGAVSGKFKAAPQCAEQEREAIAQGKQKKIKEKKKRKIEKKIETNKRGGDLKLGKGKEEKEKEGAELFNWPDDSASLKSTNERQSFVECDESSASMRAAKDLAKLSIPSLSSLQYLPSQIMDVKPAKIVDKKAAPASQSTNPGKAATPTPTTITAKPTSVRQTTTAKNQEEIKEGQAGKQRPMSGAESSEDACSVQKHDESCLFDRFCLCNCMARNHGNQHSASKSKAAKKTNASDVGTKEEDATERAGLVLGRSSPKAAALSSSRGQVSACASPASCCESSASSVNLRSNDGDVSLLSSSSSCVLSHKAGSEKNFDSSLKVSQSRGEAEEEEDEEEEEEAEEEEEEGKTGGSVVRVRDEAPARTCEKQSPTFLGLLKPSRAHASEVVKKLRGRPTPTLEARAQDIKTSSSGSANKRTPFVASSRVLGSIDDLEVSGRSSSASNASHTNSDFCSPLSSQASASSFNVLRNKITNSQDKFNRKSAEAATTTTTSISNKSRNLVTCRYCKSPSPSSADLEHKKPSGLHRRLLSPSSFFLSPSQSKRAFCCENCAAPTVTSCETSRHQESPEQRGGRRANEKSFLSRSLNRLSGRTAPKQQRVAPSPVKEPQTSRTSSSESRKQEPRATSALAFNEHQDNCSDSINSLEDEIHFQSHSLPYYDSTAASKSCPTRLLTTPEIVLSRVEYQGDASSQAEECAATSNCCCCGSVSDAMTRSTTSASHYDDDNHHHHYKQIHGRYPGQRFHGNKSCNCKTPAQQQRHGSEISFSTSDESASFIRGPFSLPSSPHGSSRQLSRSPRLSQSPVPFHSPATESTKIEDGLKVCSSEHFEKHIGNIKGDQIEAQKRLFAAWINHFAPNLIVRDLFLELQDGIKLIGLLAALTHDRQLLAEYERLNRDKRTYVNRLALTPSSRLSHISNVHIAIDYMRTKLGMKLVNLHPMDIVSGNESVILALCWNIILHFQLVGSELLAGSESSSLKSHHSGQSGTLNVGDRTSSTRGNVLLQHSRQAANRGKQLVEELSSKDLVAARGKLLAHINKRFNLRLTNLTSSLIDGDVLLAIIKQMVPKSSSFHEDARVASSSSQSSSWASMDDDEKLEHCFQLAKDYLNVPRLISATDLRQQTISERNCKPLLVYLSMLLRANPRNCSTDQMLELRQLDETLSKQVKKTSNDSEATNTGSSVAAKRCNESAETLVCNVAQKPDNFYIKERIKPSDEIRALLDELDADDKFHVGKFQATLSKIEKIDELIRIKTGIDGEQIDEDQLRERLSELKRQAEQVDSLIAWINKADKLFEAKQEASSNPAKAIEMYHRSVSFFSSPNLPQIDTILCGPTLERQYRECLAAANQHVLCMEQIMKNWLSHKQASKELLNWMIMAESKLESAFRLSSCEGNDNIGDCQFEPEEASDKLLVDRQKSRLDELIEFFELEHVDVDDVEGTNSFLANLTNLDGRSSSLSNIDNQLDYSLSGSLLSLGSTGSRVSTLTSSKRAAHNRLFDNLELQSHLLAAQLEPEQREPILVGVKTLNARMKYILEQKVPQVISDICMSINRCKMQISEHDELASEPELIDLINGELALERLVGQELAAVAASACANNEMQCRTSPETDAMDAAPVCDETGEASSPHATSSPSATRNKKNKQTTRAQARNKKNNVLSKKTSNKTVGKTSRAPSPCSTEDDCVPYYRAFWNKIVRASRMSLSFNIVLLICLAGICVVPLIQKDACCELNQAPIPTDRFTVNQKPT